MNYQGLRYMPPNLGLNYNHFDAVKKSQMSISFCRTMISNCRHIICLFMVVIWLRYLMRPSPLSLQSYFIETSCAPTDEDIDLVYTWVNGSEINFQGWTIFTAIKFKFKYIRYTVYAIQWTHSLVSIKRNHWKQFHLMELTRKQDLKGFKTLISWNTRCGAYRIMHLGLEIFISSPMGRFLFG